MDKEQLKKARDTFDLLGELLKQEDLPEEQRKEFEESRAKLAGAMMSSWLPADTERKVVMLIIFLISVYGMFNASGWFFLLWILLIPFSPRCVGEIAVFLGRMKK